MPDITTPTVGLMTDFVDEVIDEATGASSKKWAIVISALVAGAVVALWLRQKGTAGRPDTSASAVEPT
jgi:hypothetical protein